MSNYQDFFQDFPHRCQDVLRYGMRAAEARDREVTLMLMAASAGLVMPYERLKQGATHAMHADRDAFPEAAQRLDRLLAQTFVGSDLWSDEMGSWGKGELEVVGQDPDAWPELRTEPHLATQVTCGELLRATRNALAHANVYTRGGDRGQIREIILLSGQKPPHIFVRVSPADFLRSLNLWFDFIAKLHLPQRIVVEALGRTA